jgi:dextranase
MSNELKKSLIAYYDFSVAYQNLLRDGGNFNSPSVSAAAGGSVLVSIWPPQTGSVSVAGKITDGQQVLHLINFRTNSTDWRDTNGTKTIPTLIQNLKLEYLSVSTVKKIWFASPDLNSGIAFELPFQQNGNIVSFTVPSLKYWDMIVIE